MCSLLATFIFGIFILAGQQSSSEVLLRLRPDVAKSLCSQLLEYESLRTMTKPVKKGNGIHKKISKNAAESWIRSKCDNAPKPNPKSCFPFKYSGHLKTNKSRSRTKNTREDITNIVRAESHPCFRECSTDPSTKLVCYFHFVLAYYWSGSRACEMCPDELTDCFYRGCIPLDGVKRSLALVNHMFPGPPVRVCVGDTVIVDVTNDMMAEGSSIHWHGLHMKKTPWMDGVPRLTQCYIDPATTFRYEFEATHSGTYFYHSQAAFQGGDGIFGGLVIRQPPETEPFSCLHLDVYDYDLPEHEILIMDWGSELTASFFLGQHFSNGSTKPVNILVNGRGFPPTYFDDFAPTDTIHSKNKYHVPLYELRIEQYKRYRVRLISNGILKCPIVMSIEDHFMIVIAADGYDIVPYEVDSLVIYAGERWDVVVTGDKPPDSYWIKFQGLQDCEPNVFQLAVLNYEDEDTPEFHIPHHTIMTWKDAGPPKDGIQLNAFDPDNETVTGVPSKLISAAQLSILNETETDVDQAATPDYNFTLSYDFHALPGQGPNSPGNMRIFDVKSNRVGNSLYVPQLNYLSGILPPVPPLTQPESIPQIQKCNSDTGFNGLDCTSVLCQCTHWLHVKLNSIVDINLIDEGNVDPTSYPFHLHGHGFQIISQGFLTGSVKKNQLFQDRDLAGLISRRGSSSAVVKDVVAVPSPGYAIIRFRANNPGMWYFHCQLDLLRETGMNLVIQVGEIDEMPKPPSDFPKCGDYKYVVKQPPYTNHCRTLPPSPRIMIDDDIPLCEDVKAKSLYSKS